MATSRTLVGSRPTRPAARAIRSRTSASRARSAAGSVMHPLLGLCSLHYLLGQLRGERLRLGRVRSVRRELDVCVELATRALEIAFVHERHAELVVRLGVIGLRCDRLLEL